PGSAGRGEEPPVLAHDVEPLRFRVGAGEPNRGDGPSAVVAPHQVVNVRLPVERVDHRAAARVDLAGRRVAPSPQESDLLEQRLARAVALIRVPAQAWVACGLWFGSYRGGAGRRASGLRAGGEGAHPSLLGGGNARGILGRA